MPRFLAVYVTILSVDYFVNSSHHRTICCKVSTAAGEGGSSAVDALAKQGVTGSTAQEPSYPMSLQTGCLFHAEASPLGTSASPPPSHP